ncbi:sugar transporter [Lactococcus hodotermopsidis]|uniref:Sugar transporter n=1 Tax=Pseudolactococcus hodotermopsidis TaxID=2709157 RepID=A0A6A0BAD3_9LACT|nr:oligosaccharide flippase family protein [Lactococcus hodotermopsidis]GFH41593.1 sugar transporter [Lactococcus hodotermopsidis]
MKINLIKGAGILTLAGFLSKILAALYRFPYQNLVGDQGFYAFQQVYPFYSIITTLSLVALPNFLSSLIHSSDKPQEDIRLFFQTSLILSILSFLILSILCQPLAKLMGEERLALPLLAASLPLLLVPFLSLYRGIAQAKSDMTRTAISQIIEQFTRVLLIICAALTFTKLSTNVYTISFLAMLGSFIGGIVALIELIFSSHFRFKGLFTGLTDWRGKVSIIQKFGFSSVVFTFFMVYMLILQMIDVFVVKNALTHSGIISTQAEILKGIYDRGQPFLQLGLVVTTSILTDSLPKVTKEGQISDKITDFVTYLSIALTVGLVILLPEMNDVLFKSHAESLSLQIFVLQIPVISMIQLEHHDLFLAGKNKTSFVILLFGLLAKLVLVYPLSLNFRLIGASISNLISLILILSCYLIYRKKFPKQLLNLRFWLAILTMAVVVLIGNHFLIFSGRITQLFKIFLLTLAGCTTFFSIFKMKIKEILG